MQILRHILDEGIKVAESPEMIAFREKVATAFANVQADIQRLLARNPGLSEEDKATLVNIASAAEQLAAIVPEDPENPAGRTRNARP